jgi:tripartite-type tricarboxylate transporter receptor subunit TctC
MTMLVPFAPGGPTDTIGRIVAERMRAPLGQPVIIENVTGAGGSIGVGRAVRAAPDGYTISIGNPSSHVFNGAIYTLQYDLLSDFAPVALLCNQPLVIVAKKAMPANDLKQFIAWLKANPGQATQGTPGAGTAAHISGAFFARETGTQFSFVPYRGTGPAMQDLVAGQIDFMIDTPTNSLPHVRSGAIKVYAVTDKNRLAARDPDRRRGRLARLLLRLLAGAVGAEGRAERDHRQAQCRRRRDLGRPDRAATLCRAGPGHPVT